jgi:hypothetical protein
MLAWLSCLSLGQSARAEAPLKLTWHAPPECPSAAQLIALLKRRHPVLPALVIAGAIAREGDEFVLRLELTASERFERTLRASDCQLLTESAAWLIELAATQQPQDAPQAGAAGRTGEPASGTQPAVAVRAPAAGTLAAIGGARTRVPQPEPARELVHAAAEVANPSDAPRPPLHSRVGLGVGLLAVGLSGPAPDVSLDAGIMPHPLAIELRLAAAFHPSRAIDAHAEVSFRTLYALTALCIEWQAGPWLGGPCGLLATLVTFSDGRGLLATRSESAFWLAAGLAGRFGLRIDTRWRITAELGALLALTLRPSFEVSNQTVARVGLANGYGRLGTSFEFW